MWWFVTGFIFGWLAGGWYERSGGGAGSDVAELKDRARTALDESARIVEESKRQLQSAVSGGAEGGGTSQRATRRRSPPRRNRGQPSEGT